VLAKLVFPGRRNMCCFSIAGETMKGSDKLIGWTSTKSSPYSSSSFDAR